MAASHRDRTILLVILNLPFGPMKQQRPFSASFFYYTFAAITGFSFNSKCSRGAGKWECRASLHLTITFTHFATATMSMRRKIRIHAWSHPCDQVASIQSSHVRMARSRPCLVASIGPGCVHTPRSRPYDRVASMPGHIPRARTRSLQESHPCNQSAFLAGHIHATR